MRAMAFGRTHVVRPKGRHQATIVWLHGHGENGSSWAQILENLPLPNIKWICPTAPTRPLAAYGGYPCPAWFDAKEFSDEAPDDWDDLDASAAHVANLLSTEPADIKLGVGGFSMGAATALYCAMCHALQSYGSGISFQVNLQAIIALSGWLPCSRMLRDHLGSSAGAVTRAASLPIMICHGSGDDQVACIHGENSAQILNSTGFRNLVFRRYEELGHYHSPEELHEVCCWLAVALELDASSHV